MAEVHKIGIDGVDSADLAAYATVAYSDQQDGVLQTQIDGLRRDPGSIAVIESDNPVVYADGAQATRDDFGGWRYINAGGGEKINWYTLIQAPNPENALLLGQFKNFWYTFLPRTDTTQVPFITVYTYPELTPGNAAVWYRSKRTYYLNNPDPWEQVNGVYIQHLMYAGTDPLIKDDAPHWELTTLLEEGPLAANEKILYISIGTDSGQAAGNYNFAINSSGSRWENGWYANILRGVEDTSGFQLTSAATATHDNLQTQIDGILAQLTTVTSVNKLDSDNALVYADGAQPVRDSSGGWYYTNTGGGNKINWYVYSQDLAADKQSTIGEMKSIWFDFFPRSNTTRIPFIALYTVPQGDGNDGSGWYRSRFVYELEPAPTPWQSTNGVYRGHVMHVGTNPNVFPQYPHHQLTQAGYSSAGPQGDDEVVMFFAIGSDSSEGAGGYNFAINNTGSEWSEGSITTVLNGLV